MRLRSLPMASTAVNHDHRERWCWVVVISLTPRPDDTTSQESTTALGGAEGTYQLINNPVEL